MKKLGDVEGIAWAVWNVVLLGGPWFAKVLIKKAIIDVENLKNS